MIAQFTQPLTAHFHGRGNIIKIGALAFFASLCLITTFYAAMQWIADWQITHPAPLATHTVDAPTTTAKSLPMLHLFGQSFAAGGNVPITNLQWQLTGIVEADASHAENSKAYISIASEASKVYRIGDQLPYGIKMVAITANTVILKNGNHLEKLSLVREPLLFKRYHEDMPP